MESIACAHAHAHKAYASTLTCLHISEQKFRKQPVSTGFNIKKDYVSSGVGDTVSKLAKGQMQRHNTTLLQRLALSDTHTSTKVLS